MTFIDVNKKPILQFTVKVRCTEWGEQSHFLASADLRLLDTADLLLAVLLLLALLAGCLGTGGEASLILKKARQPNDLRAQGGKRARTSWQHPKSRR